MHKRSPNYLGLKVWQTAPEWQVLQASPKLYAVRIGTAASEPKETVTFEDSKIRLSTFNTEGKNLLGYSLYMKEPFGVSLRDWHVAFVANEATKHTQPKVLYKDAQIFLYSFNGSENPSYWMIVRCRPKK